LTLTGVITLILVALGKDPFPILSLGILACFLIYALWDPPEKHRNFSLSDQQQATSRALGGSGAPDILQVKQKRKKKSC